MVAVPTMTIIAGKTSVLYYVCVKFVIKFVRSNSKPKKLQSLQKWESEKNDLIRERFFLQQQKTPRFLYIEHDSTTVPNAVPKIEVPTGGTVRPGQTIQDMRKYLIIRIYFIDT